MIVSSRLSAGGRQKPPCAARNPFRRHLRSSHRPARDKAFAQTHGSAAHRLGPVQNSMLLEFRAGPEPRVLRFGGFPHSILTGIEIVLRCVKGFLYWSVFFVEIGVKKLSRKRFQPSFVTPAKAGPQNFSAVSASDSGSRLSPG